VLQGKWSVVRRRQRHHLGVEGRFLRGLPLRLRSVQARAESKSAARRGGGHPFTVQAWMFATPIAYHSSLLDEPWRTLYGLNPMAGVVGGFRWALLGTETAPGPIILVSAIVSVGLLISGAYYFRRMEKTFADVV